MKDFLEIFSKLNFFDISFLILMIYFVFQCSMKGFSLSFLSFMKWVLAPHVPSEDPTAILIVSSMTSFCMTGVFWIACNMFRVTLVDYQRRQAAK